jgi:hypothetical protein
MTKENGSYLPILDIGSFWYLIWGLKKFISPAIRILSAVPIKGRYRQGFGTLLMRVMILKLLLLAALLESSVTWAVGLSTPLSSIRVFPSSSKMLMPLNITNIIIAAGPQLATATIMAERDVNVLGAGITYILFVDPLRIGEYGPLLTEQVRPHVALP